ncbi:hypothetical protein AB0H83_31150 [Dactylosporangium sp. NPDC050688]|uniref:hypothetical protein n=1 Tax=Dactylosporangium sp. NPDC050688 TaxID=3157217 RepID=UPI00340D3217
MTLPAHYHRCLEVLVEPGWRPGDFDAEQIDEALLKAARLYEHIVSGGLIEPVATSLRLDDGEYAYADGPMEYSRFYGEDTYLHESPTSYLSPTAVVGSTIRNRVSRESAEPRWRDTHTTRVALTNRRLLISVDHRWSSFHHQSIAEFLPELPELSLVLTLFENVPLRLRAPDLPAQAVLLASFLYTPQEVAEIPGFGVLF